MVILQLKCSFLREVFFYFEVFYLMAKNRVFWYRTTAQAEPESYPMHVAKLEDFVIIITITCFVWLFSLVRDGIFESYRLKQC